MQSDNRGAQKSEPHTTAESPGRDARDRDAEAAATETEKPGVQIGGSRAQESDADPENADGVWIARSGHGRQADIYHTDAECHLILRAKNASTVPRDALPNAEECHYCSGAEESTNPSGKGSGHYEAALAHGRDQADEPMTDGGAWELTTDHSDRRVWTHYDTGVRVEAMRFRGPAATLTGAEPDDAEEWSVCVRPPERMGEAALEDLTAGDRYGEASAMERARAWMDEHPRGVPQTYRPDTAADYHDTEFELVTDGGDGCPSCGGRIASSVIGGPGDAVVSPCGCEVAPGQLPHVRRTGRDAPDFGPYGVTD